MSQLTLTPRFIIAELEKRGIMAHGDVVGGTSVVTFKWRGVERQLIGMIAEFQPAYSQRICNNKVLTQWYLEKKTNVSMPAMEYYQSDQQALAFMNKHRAIVVKPVDAGHGNGITVNVKDADALHRAIVVAGASSSSAQVLMQKQVSGKDARVFVINGTVVAASHRIPAQVIGDGKRTIYELIEEENRISPHRDAIPNSAHLNMIDCEAAKRFLGERINCEVPSDGETIQVVGTANIGTGGKSVECLEQLPKSLLEDAERAARSVKAFCCGVDFLYDESTGSHYVIEMNSSPSFGPHMTPTEGAAVDVAALYVDALFEEYDRRDNTLG